MQMIYNTMGNITNLKRNGIVSKYSGNQAQMGLVDDLSISYDGNKLQDDVNRGSGSWFYGKPSSAQVGRSENDCSGNPTVLKSGITLSYNNDNLISVITDNSKGKTFKTYYNALGTKLLTTVSGSIRDYVSNAQYVNGVLDKIFFDEGYFNAVDRKMYYYVKDYQGSIRSVVDNYGLAEVESNNYYPMGVEFGESVDPYGTQRYKYTGQERMDEISNNFYDYHARIYMAYLGRFMQMDPMCEQRYNISPYAYCSNNSVNRVDPTGMLDDWVRDKKTDEYIWMDNVTSASKTPNGYVYVGANDNDILTDMNVPLSYQPINQKAYGAAMIGGDNVGPLGQGIPAPTGRIAQGNLSVSANVSYNIMNSTENNTLGKKFEGITVNGSLSQVSGYGDADATAQGYLLVSYGEKSWYNMLKTPTEPHVYATGTTLTTATVHIPASEINRSSYMSTALISAGVTNPALIRPPAPIKMTWNLQVHPVFRKR